jgi:hypothetical protein
MVFRQAIISATFNGFDSPHEWEKQPANVFRYTEDNFKLRTHLTPHAQSKIPKCFGWDLEKGYDYYLWVDSCYELYKGATEFLLKELGDNDILVFPHPFNKTVKEEYEFLKRELPKSKYLQKRYTGELLDELWERVDDGPIYHAAIFAYKNTPEVQKALKEWWYYSSRFHLDDQISWPTVLKDLKVKVMDKKIEEYPYWKYRRHNG